MAITRLFGISILVLLSSVVIIFVQRQISGKRLPIQIHGYTAPGFEQLKDVFRENFDSGADEGGAAFAAYHRGQVVADLWGGYSDVETQTTWKQDTISMFYSTTKGMSALCLAMLVDRGLLDYEKPVKHYWPEFAQGGKDNITVKMAVAHQAGLPSLGEPFTSYEQLSDHRRISKLLEQSKPVWPAGTRHGYHSFTHGYIIDQIIRRVDAKRRSVGQFFKEEVADPCNITFTIGTPKTEYHRIARPKFHSLGISNVVQVLKTMIKSFLGNNEHIKNTLADFGSNIPISPATANSVDMIVHEQPSANGIGTARDVAKLYNILVTKSVCPGLSQPLLSQPLLHQMTELLTRGEDLVIGHLLETRFSYGFFLLETPKGNNAFGSPGYGVQHGFGDVEHQLSWAYLTNTIWLDLASDQRISRLWTRLYQLIDGDVK